MIATVIATVALFGLAKVMHWFLIVRREELEGPFKREW